MSLPNMLLGLPEISIPNLFSLNVDSQKDSIHIQMLMKTSCMTTTSMPETTTILKSILPSILVSRCYNDRNIPFADEVMSTELGHLFEHILLEYLCILKIAKGAKEAIFNGWTDWDWGKEPSGTFHITIDIGQDDEDIAGEGIQQTIKLFKMILNQKDPIKSYPEQFSGENQLLLLSKNINYSEQL